MAKAKEKEHKKPRRKWGMTHNLFDERRIKLLSQYFPLDEETRTFQITLRYDKAEDILDVDVSRPDRPNFKDDVLLRVSDILEQIPSGYQANISFQIKDYQGYDPKSLLSSFNDAMELNHYRGDKEARKKWVQAVLLTLVGIAILAVMGVGAAQGWWGEGETASLTNEVLDIAGWVFIWEAVSILFLSPSEIRSVGLRIRRKVAEIAFWDEEGNSLVNEGQKGLFHHWIDEGIAHRAGRILLLASGAGYLGLAGYQLFHGVVFLVQIAPHNDQEMWVDILAYVASLLIALLHFAGGFSGLSRYQGHGLFYRFASAYAVISLLFVILEIAYAAFSQSAASIVSGASSFALATLFVLGYFLAYGLPALRKDEDDPF